ncbi:MAG: replicative DNA helicase [Treponema sp.]|nr:replicative DNA helicase [Treponema sp.]
MASELKDNIPPHNLEAEQAALGALLMDWGAFSEVITVLKAEHFYSFQNQIIYSAMTSLAKQNVHGDSLVLINELEHEGKIDQAGGAVYIMSLTDKVPTSANINYYIDIIIDCSTRRDLIKLSAELKSDSFDSTKDSRHLLEESEKKIFSLSYNNDTTKVHIMSDIVNDSISRIEKIKERNGELSGVPSGIVKLDTMTNGFQNSELIIIGARPSIGKTAFALSMMQTIAVEKNIPCGFFSLEMSYQSIGFRLLSQISRVQSSKFRSGYLSLAELQKLQDAAGRCYNSPLYIVDTPNMQLLDLRAMARRMKLNYGVKIIFIDYIGLISTDNPRAPVYESQSEISKSLKALARELDIPIVALCQVARDAEGQEPNLAQLRGSGSIEQDADVVLFLHRDRKTMEDENGKHLPQDAKCIVAKQRNGPTGDLEMIYFPLITKFENKSREDE